MAAVRLPVFLVLRLVTRIPVLAAVVIAIVVCAPGFDSDERRLDMRTSAETMRQLEKQQRTTAWEAGRDWFTAALHGDFGNSRIFDQPVSQIMAERIPVTARATALALLLGWVCAFCALVTGPAGLFGLLDAAILCTPAALLGFVAVVCRAPAEAAIALIVFARAHTWLRRIHMEACGQPWAMSARAFGLSPWRILHRYVLPHSWPQLAAVMASSVTLAIGTAVPVEVICETPGLGQLAWRATLGRDLPLLLAVTLCMASCSLAVASLSDAAGARR
jgi:peptide/nickel transport system permease protein